MRWLAIGVALLACACSTGPGPLRFGYLGGSGTDDCDGIALDGAGDIYLACHSDSPDFPHLPAKPAPRPNADISQKISFRRYPL
jgi:hypothetical protein